MLEAFQYEVRCTSVAKFWYIILYCVLTEWLKLLLQPNEDLYEQKPEEPPASVATPSSNPPIGSSFPSRFEYVDTLHTTEKSTGGPQMVSHVAPPKSSSFFADFGMDGGYQKKGSNSSKVQVNIY